MRCVANYIYAVSSSDYRHAVAAAGSCRKMLVQNIPAGQTMISTTAVCLRDEDATNAEKDEAINVNDDIPRGICELIPMTRFLLPANLVTFCTSPIYTSCPEKMCHFIFDYSSRISWWIFKIIFIPLETEMNITCNLLT